ncbi:MAG: HAD-superfamily hydrolase, subfamily IA, variant 3 [Gammaproteobacteria bacterium]|nr:HAD-superfamily hydrolase, subfamily IA, variant 3 [Gammaproteobacteria bacterium]
MANNIEVILFDLGGVLVELSGVPTLLSWSGETITPEKLWQRWLTSTAVREFETGRTRQDHFARQLIDEMSLRIDPDEFLASFTHWPRGMYPGAQELLSRIPPDYTLAVLSNSNSLHWPRMLDEIGVAGMFEHLFASHLIGKLKPDVEVFEHVLTELDCSPAGVLYVDDNQRNVDVARSLGIRAEVTQGIAAVEKVLSQYHII